MSAAPRIYGQKISDAEVPARYRHFPQAQVLSPFHSGTVPSGHLLKAVDWCKASFEGKIAGLVFGPAKKSKLFASSNREIVSFPRLGFLWTCRQCLQHPVDDSRVSRQQGGIAFQALTFILGQSLSPQIPLYLESPLPLRNGVITQNNGVIDPFCECHGTPGSTLPM